MGALGGLLDRPGDAARQQHLGSQRKSYLFQTAVSRPSGQEVHGIDDLDRVAGRGGQRFVHARDQGRGRQPGSAGDLHEATCQRPCLARRRHEGAVAGLDVQHQRPESRCQLLRQDRGCYQRNRLDRTRNVTDGVETLVGGREVGGLADYGAAGLRHRLAEQLLSGLALVAGNGIHLVERAAGVAEPATGDHRHESAAGGNDRGQHQRNVVAHAAGRMLVRDGPRQIRPVEHDARIAHGKRQGHRLVAAHALQEHRHG